jgi:hypothetical protein
MEAFRTTVVETPADGAGYSCSDITFNDVGSGNWVGHVVPSSYISGSPAFDWTESSWVEPSVPSSGDDATASIWSGTGVSSLVQSGVLAQAQNPAVYKFWNEDYPYDNAIFEGPVIRPGQTAYVDEQYIGNSTANYYEENSTTGAAQSFEVPGGTPDDGWNAANFILERVHGYALANFGSATDEENDFGTPSASYALTTNNDVWKMTENCLWSGTSLTAGSVSNTNFSLSWVHGAPYDDNC